MKVTVRKLTDLDLMREACDATRKAGMKPSTMTLDRIYSCEHSPSRVILFWVEFKGLPTFVSTHLVRHSATGQSHFVESNRDDRGGVEAGRLTPVTHKMLLNAQHLLDMSRKRLCFASHKATVGAFVQLRSAIRHVDPDLAKYMVPECVVRGYCPELRECKPGVVNVLRAYQDAPHCLNRQAVLTRQSAKANTDA